MIYTEKYNKKQVKVENSDWAGQYSNLLGYSNSEMAEVLRGYIAIHTDHEGGNVSAHSAYLASSALCDPYLSLCNAVNGLAGPLHGLANQEVLKFLLKIKVALKENHMDHLKPSDERVKEFINGYLDKWLET